MVLGPDKVIRKEKEISPELNVSKWKDHKWQLKHIVRDIDTFQRLTGIIFPENERRRMERTLNKFPLAITPYYLSLIDVDNYDDDPIFKQSFANPRELMITGYDKEDPLGEDEDSPVETITHRYPDRVLFLVSNICAMYCRHCTRKRKVGEKDSIPGRKQIEEGLRYIRETPEIRDVLLSGGDPLMLSVSYLDWILSELDEIEHVEVVRIGTRIPAVLPFKVTDNMVEMLKKYHPLWVNTHFNHPREMTVSAKTALRKLADAGIPLGNQSVLLAGVNDCPRIIRRLVHLLVRDRVRPYYLYQCDLSEGLSHFRTPVGKGIAIMESLVGHTSGFAVPRYVVDAPGGGGKIPLMPNYIVSWGTNRVVLRNYEGVITTYKEPDSYEPVYCDRECEECDLELDLEEGSEYKALGIEKLLSDMDETITLTPKGTERAVRREEAKEQ